MSSERRPSGDGFLLIAVVYFVSGAVGLIDEVTFSKYLSLVFGATAYASSAVLVAFMGGLAAGAMLATRFEHRVARPLFAYGIVEAVVGVACAIAPSLFGLVTSTYVALAKAHPGSLLVLSLVRYALAVSVVAVPAVAMGATLPLMARIIDTLPSRGTQRRLGLLYGLNTAGGATGSIVSAYLLLPAIGLSLTMRSSAATSLVLAAAAIALGRDLRVSDCARSERTSAPHIASLSTIALLSGLLVFASEVVFVHLLALVVGTSAYVFGLILAIFLVSLAIGAPLAGALARRTDGALRYSLAFTALAMVLTTPVWSELPRLFEALGPHVRSWHGRELVRALTAFAALVVPVSAMGMSFPLVLRAVAKEAAVGALVGRVTAFNTLGAIAGSLISGFVLLPLLGSERSLFAIAVGYAVAAFLAPSELPRRIAVVPAGLGLAALALGLLLPRWDLARLTSGTNVYFERHMEPGEVVSLHEDVHGGVTTVLRSPGGTHTLYTNGKFQGNDSVEMAAQESFAHLPALFAKRFDRALVVGLGTGTTLGALASYPYAHIEVAELSPGIVAAARRYFTSKNRRALDDPRVELRLEDGRNLLLTSNDGRYDLITIELTSIWFAGAANLYNREFYEVAAKRLAHDGVLQQWLQLHHTQPRDLASVVATARSAFAHVVVFARGHQGFVIASQAPLVASRARLASLEATPKLRTALGDNAHLGDFMHDLLVADEGIDRFVDDVASEARLPRNALLSTDDSLLLEYRTPRNNVPDGPPLEAMLALLWRYHASDAVARHVGP